MPVIVKLRSYLADLEETERARPEYARRAVPSMTALADDIKISRTQLHKIASGKIESLRLSVASDIIRAMRKRGFDMTVTDLLEYVE